MDIVIGEIISEYRKEKDGLFSRAFSGTGMAFPRLRLVTALSSDHAGKDMEEMLGERSADVIRKDAHSAFMIGEDLLIKGSAPSVMMTDELADTLSHIPDISGAVLSGTLLSYNPSADAITDTVLFRGIGRIAVFTGCPGWGGRIYDRVISTMSSSVENFLISSDPDEILAFLRSRE